MNLKKTIAAFITLLIIGGSTVLNAQEKYDLAVVGYLYDTPKSHIVVSINGEKFEQYDVEREELQGKVWGITMNPLLKQVNKLQSEGWEVVGGLTTSGLPSVSLFYYSLRKKR
jgi:hypothetical protein